MKIRWIALAAVVTCLLSLCACGGGTADDETTAYPDKAIGFQTEMPAKGDTVAVMHTSMGDISLRFFPEAAPKTVENFTTHAKNGYYNGVTFHRVMNDFMIQSGDPTATGRGGESIWGGEFEDEFDSKLFNIRGALSMANGGPNTNGSQFFINQAGPDSSTASGLRNMKAYFEKYQSKLKAKTFAEFYYSSSTELMNFYRPGAITDEILDLYMEKGGNMSLDGFLRQSAGHTVFGQVFAGMDVVDAIAAVKTDPSNDKPLEDVTITSVEILTYAG